MNLCKACGGNGTIDVRESGGSIIGTSVCPACDGRCEAPHVCPLVNDAVEKALEEEAAALESWWPHAAATVRTRLAVRKRRGE